MKVGRQKNAGPPPLCACGCEKEVAWARGKSWRKFVWGHHIVLNNPNKGEHVRGDRSPMRRLEVLAKMSGTNHWRHRPENKERAEEYSKEQSMRRGILSTNWKGGRFIDSEGYVRIRHGRSYVLEHRLIVENYLGRNLAPVEVVHHIDGDKINNRIENLQLLKSHKEHVAQHNVHQALYGKVSEKHPLLIQSQHLKDSHIKKRIEERKSKKKAVTADSIRKSLLLSSKEL